jgi:REP element-mobilizing transposase RayT
MEELFKDKYRIQSTRLKDWDYSQEGFYYITICTKDREPFFGRIINNKIKLSSIGEIVEQFWKEIPEHYENVSLDEYIIMPDHMHGIIIINESHDHYGNARCRDVVYNVSTGNEKNKFMSEISPKSYSLPIIIREFKSAVTRQSNKNGFNNFKWQARYYDHIIRNEKDLNRIRNYIKNNPYGANSHN